MIHWLNLGGPPAWMIVAVGLVATVLFFERWLCLRRARVGLDDFLRGIFNVVRRRNLAEGVVLCDETPGPVARMVRTALLHVEEDPQSIRAAMIEAGKAELPRLEQRMYALGAIPRVATLLGLFGTLLALMRMLLTLQQQGPLVHAGELAGHMYGALVCAALGLAIAIPAFVGYQLLVSLLDAILVDMEETLSRVREQLVRERVRWSSEGPPP